MASGRASINHSARDVVELKDVAHLVVDEGSEDSVGVAAKLQLRDTDAAATHGKRRLAPCEVMLTKYLDPSQGGAGERPFER